MAILKLGRFLKKRSGDNIKKLPYVKKEGMLSIDESTFYKRLISIFNNRVVVLPKVPLIDIFAVNTRDKKNKEYYLEKLGNRKIDFLVCSVEMLVPICAIELNDDFLKKDDDEKDRDFVKNLFSSGKIPFVSFNNIEKYSLSEIKGKIELRLSAYINKDNIFDGFNSSKEIGICTNCGTVIKSSDIENLEDQEFIDTLNYLHESRSKKYMDK